MHVILFILKILTDFSLAVLSLPPTTFLYLLVLLLDKLCWLPKYFFPIWISVPHAVH